MFTGIVTAIGTIEGREERGDLRLRIACPFDPEAIAVGASIACSGVCLTVVERGLRQARDERGKAWFAVDVSAETLSRTAKDSWAEGARLNLEPSLRLGDELGGHIVSGHVDAVGAVVGRAGEGDSIRVTLEAPKELAPFIAPKGSIAVDGVSLTVSAVSAADDPDPWFEVSLIPTTLRETTLGARAPGDPVNLEVDVIAKYVERLLGGRVA
jgi:riboflavin synthase